MDRTLFEIVDVCFKILDPLLVNVKHLLDCDIGNSIMSGGRSVGE
jgi:hypothetical protein